MMPSTDTKSKFLELRAKDWSLARISKQLDVSVRTLVTQLKCLDERIAVQKLEFVETKDLYRIAASVRAQVRQLVIPIESFDPPTQK